MSDRSASFRRPTMQDVAREAGVSLSTVDRVLNLRANVRGDTAQRIAEAAQRLGFHGRNVIEQRLLRNRPSVRLGFVLLKHATFYQGLAEALAEAAAQNNRAQVRVMIHYLDELDPAGTAETLRTLRGQFDALGLVAPDHPVVREAVQGLQSQGTRVIALISELAAGTGYVGLDSRRVGRTAGWFITRTAGLSGGPVAVMLGTQRFQCQELCEMSFRSFMAEQSGDWDLLASRMTLEDEDFAHGNAMDLLSSHPDLAGIYIGGGGIDGVIRALRDVRPYREVLPAVVCQEMTPTTRTALQEGLLAAVLSHPVGELARQTVHYMIEAALNPDLPAERHLLPIQIDIRESV